MLDNYTEPIPDYGDVMTLNEYLHLVATGMFIDYDGSGCPAKDNKMDRHITIVPSKPERIPKDATHIVWFNR